MTLRPLVAALVIALVLPTGAAGSIPPDTAALLQVARRILTDMLTDQSELLAELRRPTARTTPA